ncbi:DinB family protein [Paenibacillus sp. MAH-36]|uniref:DinB family protein n=1 Tax=Paenibacillus violae TaxID=3077234 RepID=A0ABU3R6B8_9BACL|nr:DinB family protein [Paenibacillus sp. PFR10]MDU0199795.1 DinB family protein [Paenibacillus sp. PFR10]
MLKRPGKDEYAPYYEQYISKVTDEEYEVFLDRQRDEILALFGDIDEEKARYRYAPGKWSLKEVLGHITDTERVMSYRMLRISRGDSTLLPGFDQDVFVANTSFDELSIEDLLNDFKAVRQATLTLRRTIADSAWSRQANVSTFDITARGLAYVIAGHAEHHLTIVKERYL